MCDLLLGANCGAVARAGCLHIARIRALAASERQAQQK
jgi:hypothetical protein